VREQNEDRVLISEFEHSDVILLVVADGVGGHAGGEVASQLCIDQLQQSVGRAVLQANSGGGYGEHWLTHTLQQAVLDANQQIINQQHQQPSLANMATTVVALLVKQQAAALCHLGDSRCYCYLQQLQQLTTDHSLLQDMLRDGKIDQQTYELSPMHHVISRALGLHAEPKPDCQLIKLQPTQRYLLCSDGLTDCVSDAQIQHLLERYKDVDECVDELIKLANDHGGPDNISVVLLSVVEG
jgi:protein phosphatase